jgi:hypothetical protein
MTSTNTSDSSFGYFYDLSSLILDLKAPAETALRGRPPEASISGKGRMEGLEWNTKSEDSKVELVELFNVYFLCQTSSGLDPATKSSPTAFESLRYKKQLYEATLINGNWGLSLPSGLK